MSLVLTLEHYADARNEFVFRIQPAKHSREIRIRMAPRRLGRSFGERIAIDALPDVRIDRQSLMRLDSEPLSRRDGK